MKRVSPRSARRLPADPRARIAVAVSDCSVPGQTVVSEQTWLWAQSRTDGDEEGAGNGPET